MFLKTPAKTSVALLALVAPCALVACGSHDENNNAAAASSEASTTVTKTSEKTTSSAPETTKTKTKTAAPKNEKNDSNAAAGDGDGNADGQNAEPNQGAQQPQADGNGFEPLAMAPVDGGQDADPATTDEINQLVRGMYDTSTMREFVGYLPAHACQRALNEGQYDQLDLEQIPDVPMSSLDSKGWNEAYVESVDDIKVNGDQASATVNLHTSQGEDTNTLRFLHEGDRWTFCNA